MKPFLPLLALSILLLSACGPTLTPAPSPTGRGESALTPAPTRTPTPTLTPTPTITPTPSLPPEALTRLEGRGWRIEGDKVVAGKAVWYTLSPQGEWLPAKEYRLMPEGEGDYHKEHWRDCTVPVEDILTADPNESPFLNWLRMHSRPFPPEAAGPLEIRVRYSVVFDPKLEIIKGRESARSRPEAACRLVFEGNEYLVYPIEMADPGGPANPDKNIWLIGVFPLHYLGESLNHPYEPYPPDIFNWILNGYFNEIVKKGLIPLLVKGCKYPTGQVPLCERYRELAGGEAMAQKFEAFIEGDPRPLDGAVVLVTTDGIIGPPPP